MEDIIKQIINDGIDAIVYSLTHTGDRAKYNDFKGYKRPSAAGRGKDKEGHPPEGEDDEFIPILDLVDQRMQRVTQGLYWRAEEGPSASSPSCGA